MMIEAIAKSFLSLIEKRLKSKTTLENISMHGEEVTVITVRTVAWVKLNNENVERKNKTQLFFGMIQ